VPVTEILRVEDLRVTYRDRARVIKAVDGVSFTLQEGRTLALVGESGCGKTSVALAILGLMPDAGSIDTGRVLFDGVDLRAMRSDDLRRVRGRQISMIFQDAASGLNPVLSIGSQVEEIVRAHLSLSKDESRAMTLNALRRQGIRDPEMIMEAYPFHLSGGMCQRVMIAIATVLHPRVIIADEPTSALDVTVQAGILRELDDLKRHLGASIILITHDLGVVAQMADDVAVMYAGRIVERADALDVYGRPSHPYTSALMQARPRLDGDPGPLPTIRGTPPNLGALTGECAFLPRCAKAVSACRSEPWPALREVAPRHEAACFNPMFHAEVSSA
jgi:oligopeptide/dipeptide ABC transporter ATP-binding protein